VGWLNQPFSAILAYRSHRTGQEERKLRYSLEDSMSAMQVNPWQYSNRYSADKACDHCEGIIRHESWCITRSANILYAYQAVLQAAKLSEGDHIILHALGVRWAQNICAGACKPVAAAAT
jgi:hypothetical protein